MKLNGYERGCQSFIAFCVRATNSKMDLSENVKLCDVIHECDYL